MIFLFEMIRTLSLEGEIHMAKAVKKKAPAKKAAKKAAKKPAAKRRKAA
jgi:hypothetical protein